MILGFTQKGAVKIDRNAYVKGVLHDLPEEMIGLSATLAAHFIFEINDECDKRDKDKKSVLYTM
jgi:hypothetical protein